MFVLFAEVSGASVQSLSICRIVDRVQDHLLATQAVSKTGFPAANATNVRKVRIASSSQ